MSDNDIVDRLRERACPAGQPHTGDDPQADHGHTDCWLHHQAADEIEQLRAAINEWCDAALVYDDDRWTKACDELRAIVGR